MRTFEEIRRDVTGTTETIRQLLEMQSAGATPEQGAALLVGTGSWLSSGVESAKSLIAHWETRADYRRGRGWDDSAMAFQYCANQLRAAIGMPERRQPEDNNVHDPRGGKAL